MSPSGDDTFGPGAQPLRGNILCVDDEPSILSSLRRLFRANGYMVRTADCASTALQMLQQEPADLVISDMRMPQMNGAEFQQQVRERWPQSVRFLLTGQAEVASIIDAINRGEIKSDVDAALAEADRAGSAEVGPAAPEAELSPTAKPQRAEPTADSAQVPGMPE